MSVLLKEIELQTRQLSPDDRARLAEMLLESVQEPAISQIEAAWEVEISARIAAWKRGETITYAAEDVLAEARALCK
jgi:putative addiction module component (TIGR02574 family)